MKREHLNMLSVREAPERLAKDLTVWQAWTQRVKKSRYSPRTVLRTDVAIRAWEKYTADPTIGAISPSTFILFRDRSASDGAGVRTIGLHCRLIAHIVRTFRPLPRLPHQNVKASPDATLTIREAFAKFYPSQDLSPRTVRKFRHHFNWWERFTANKAIGLIETADFEEARAKALADGLSPVTSEGIVSDIATVLKYLSRIKILPSMPWVGKRLKRRPQLKPTPTIGELAKVYAQCRTVCWPAHHRRLVSPNGKFSGSKRIAAAEDWWRGLLALAYFTALRRGDLLTLRWDEIENGWIRRKMAKTGFLVEIPIHPCLQTHLDALPRKKNSPYLLGYGGSLKQIRGQMRELAAAAGVRPFLGVQSLRRLSAQQYEKARPGAGGLVLGHRYRNSADRSYLNPSAALVEALPNLAIPEGMGPQPTKPTPSVNALDVLRGLGRNELVKLLGELLGDRVTA
ncbi:MAG TPA: hypothetical protein VFG04_08940 [Planctomycetaceae bacterium]|jgi:integrase|nr:hypothetical protein [Planctomycetaceae bacterium]